MKHLVRQLRHSIEKETKNKSSGKQQTRIIIICLAFESMLLLMRLHKIIRSIIMLKVQFPELQKVWSVVLFHTLHSNQSVQFFDVF